MPAASLDRMENALRRSERVQHLSPTSAYLEGLERLAPTVCESHFAEWPARGSSELPERIAQGDQRRGLDVGRNAEQRFHICVAEPVNGRNATADAEGARRQHDVLDGRINRRSRRDRNLNVGI